MLVTLYYCSSNRSDMMCSRRSLASLPPALLHNLPVVASDSFLIRRCYATSSSSKSSQQPSQQHESHFSPIGIIPSNHMDQSHVILPPTPLEVDQLTAFLQAHNKLVCITGAGISTASGIPDYRGPNGSYRVPGHKPILHQEFMSSHATRQRYWARAVYGYQRVRDAQPNDTHHALHQLLTSTPTAHIRQLVTQNVDGLHHKCYPNFRSGPDPHHNRPIVDLHGRIDRVICMHCQALYHRDVIQQKIFDLNPKLFRALRDQSSAEIAQRLRADGDMEMQQLVNYSEVYINLYYFTILFRYLTAHLIHFYRLQYPLVTHARKAS